MVRSSTPLPGRNWKPGFTCWPATATFNRLRTAILKVGPGRSFFYCDGEFTVNVPSGPTDLLVERGTEFAPLRRVVCVPAQGTVDVELELRRWTDLQSQQWYPGNTHLHYDDKEQRLKIGATTVTLTNSSFCVILRQVLIKKGGLP
jgi:hypothetical protein